MKRLTTLTGLLCLIGLASTVRAADPAWWTNSSTQVIDPNADHSTSANYEPANLGQLKNMAAAAKIHLDENLSGGAGTNIDNLISGFSTDPSINYAPANIGQLKAVAKPFYDRLIEAGYDTKQNLIDHGYTNTWSSAYPWDTNNPVPTSANYAPVNIGQLKSVFSFDLSNLDSDLDGLPDAWEMAIFGDLTHDPTTDTDGDGIPDVQEVKNGTNWNDFFNGAAPVVTLEMGNNQTAPPGAFEPLPLAIKITNAQGTPYAGGSVTFTITQGDGSIQPTSDGTPGATQTRATDASGESRMYFRTSTTANATTTITATYGSHTFTFTEASGAANMETTASPFGPLNLQAQLNADGSEDLTWDQNPDDSNPVPIWVKQNDQWVQIGTAPAGTTTYHIPAQ